MRPSTELATALEPLLRALEESNALLRHQVEIEREILAEVRSLRLTHDRLAVLLTLLQEAQP